MSNKILSISILKRDCIGHEFDDGQVAMNRGSLLHRAIENGGKFDNKVSYKGFVREIPYNEEDVPAIEAIAKETIRRYVKQGGRQESIISMSLPEGYVMEGIMDYCEIDEENKTALILDWKSGWSGAYNKENRKSMYQAYIYSFMLFGLYPFLGSITFKYIFLDENFVEIEIVVPRAEYEAKIEATKKWVVETYHKQTFKVGEHCSNCKKMNECKFVGDFMAEKKEQIKAGALNAITTDAEYNEIAAFIKIAEKQQDEYKKTKENDAAYWYFRNNSKNQLHVDALTHDETRQVIEALAKDGIIDLKKAEYEALMGKMPERVTSSQYKTKVFKIAK